MTGLLSLRERVDLLVDRALLGLWEWIDRGNAPEGRLWVDIAYYLSTDYADTAHAAAYGHCPYYQQTGNKICNMGCWEEPECQTCEPCEGWPADPGPLYPIKILPDAVRAGIDNWGDEIVPKPSGWVETTVTIIRRRGRNDLARRQQQGSKP